MTAPPDPRIIRSNRDRRTPSTVGSRRLLLVLGGLLLLAAAGLGLRALLAPSSPPPAGTTGATSIILSAPVGGPDGREGPRIGIRVQPARPGENIITISLTTADGRPLPAPTSTLTLGLTSLDDDAPQDTVDVLWDDTGSATLRGKQLNRGGWWRIAATVDAAGKEPVTVPFYLLLPDPNVNGAGAVPVRPSTAEARALYQRGLQAMTSLHRVRFQQSMADGQRVGSLSHQAVNDGADGQLPAFTYRVAGGLEAVVIGGYRWLREPGEGWVQQGGPPMVPPAAWGDEYAGATGFRLGRVEDVDGEPCQLLTFVVPETTVPHQQAAAWYAWWVGTRTGQVRREAMISRSHYMTNAFSDFDAPLPITPPTDASPVATPMAPAR